MDTLRQFDQVLVGDQRWQYFGRTLKSHYDSVSAVTLAETVPEEVRQQFETARNAWLYAFFAYRLLQVAILMAHTTVELALKEKARQEGLSKEMSFHDLLGKAIKHRWIADKGFSVVANQAQSWDEHRELLRLMGGPDCGPFTPSTDDQGYAKQLAHTIRLIRNDVAHGQTLLVHDISPFFRTIAEFINQLFPGHSSKAALTSALK